jgi:hypothetical protein
LAGLATRQASDTGPRREWRELAITLPGARNERALHIIKAQTISIRFMNVF